MDMQVRSEVQARYRETHREELNHKSKQRWAENKARTERVEAFAAALEEIQDGDVRRELYAMLDGLTTHFIGLEYTPAVAEANAVEILARLTWKGVNAPRRRMRQLGLVTA
jgi:hypothetical protein